MGKYAGAASIRFAIARSERLYSLRDSEFHFMLQKAIVRSALSLTHTKPPRTCRTTWAFHQFIRPARSLGDRNLSQSSRRSHRTPAARNARIVNSGSQTLAKNSRFTHDRDSRQCPHSNSHGKSVARRKFCIPFIGLQRSLHLTLYSA